MVTNVGLSEKIPAYVREIIGRLNAGGFPAYAVGGCVRDLLLGRVPRDWDVTTAAPGQRVRELFEKTVPTGARFGTVTVILPEGSAEVTTFRQDGPYRDHRRPQSVEYVSSLSHDLARRDFTVNAMAMDAAGRITDPFGGRADLGRRLLRCVGDPARRFSEDALRMLRGLRLSAELDFAIEKNTLAAIRELASGVHVLSGERVREELFRTVCSPRPQTAGRMVEYGLLSPYLTGPGASAPWERLTAVPDGLKMPVLAVLMALAGETRDAGELLRSLRCTAREAKLASAAGALAGELSCREEDIRLALSCHEIPAVLCASGALGFYAAAQRLAREGRFVTSRDLAISGDDLRALGLAGPEIGRLLASLARCVTLGEAENRREALLPLARQLMSNR